MIVRLQQAKPAAEQLRKEPPVCAAPMLSFDEKLKFVRTSSFLDSAPLDILCEVALAAVEQSFRAGEFIFAKNDPAAHFYVLLGGTVGHPEIHAGRTQLPIARQVRVAGQLFGFAAAVPGQPPRVASARCETPTRVLRIDGRWFQRLCNEHGPDGYALLQQFAQVHAGYEHTVLGRPGWISVRNSGKLYGTGRKSTVVIDDCSLEIRAGEFCAIVGPRGCGKTTLARLIAGLERLTSGVIYLDGELVNWPGLRVRANSGLVAVSTQSTLAPKLTIRENLLRAVRTHEDETRAGNVDALLARLRLSGIANCRPGEVFPATARCFEIIQALLRDPRVLILDEPSQGLDAPGKAAVQDFLLELFELTDKTFLLTTEDMDEASRLADRLLVMDGRPARIVQTVVLDSARPASGRLAAGRESEHPTRGGQDAAGAAPRSVQFPASGAADVPSIRTRAEILRREPTEAEDRLSAPAASGEVASVGVVNSIKESVLDGRFFWTVEFIPSVDKVLRDELHKLGGISEAMRSDAVMAGFAVTDRVHSDRDPDPVAAGSHLLRHSGKQPLVHFSGKDRDIDDLSETIAHMASNGLENMLLVTGDRLKQEPRDRRPRYLESVCAIQAAKRINPALFVAAVLNPFKYREEDAMAQYLKLGKKVGAGADFIITQIGYDMRKYEEALSWVDGRNYRVPLVANVMPMTAARARYIRQHQLAGVTVTDSVLALLEAEERLLSDKGMSRVLRRLALQVLGVRLYGYSGVQITGLHSTEKLAALRRQVATLADLCSDRTAWTRAWEESLTLPEGGQADPAPGHDPWYLASQHTRHAGAGEKWKYRLMKGVHGLAFNRGIAARVAAPLFRRVTRNGTVDSMLARMERAIKAPLLGCETCGSCRLAATQYVCPETCPKGLANGACGGTTDNLCEFRDRECIHSMKYRIAKDAGALDQLEKWLIPAVPQRLRGTCSWPPHFRGESPGVQVIEFAQPGHGT